MIPPFLDPDAPTPGECSQRLLFFREMVAYWGRARLVAYALGDAERQAAAQQNRSRP